VIVGGAADTARQESSHGFTRGGFPGLHVLCPLSLPGGHDAALRCLPQHPAAGKVHPKCDMFLEEKRVTLSGVRYWDLKQGRARLVQVASKGTTVELESLGEDRCR